ncbi:MAG: TauD/TfdA dioxygenase family protein [Rhodospirillales bacterium]
MTPIKANCFFFNPVFRDSAASHAVKTLAKRRAYLSLYNVYQLEGAMTALADIQNFKITKLTEHVGAEVTGIDLRDPLDPKTLQALNDAIVDNVALVFRGQQLTPAELLKAVGQFGELMPDQNQRYVVEGLPLVSVLSNRHKDSTGKQAKIAKNANWHTDHTNQEFPPKFTTLYGVDVPSKGGGTSVCNMNAAFEALPEDIKVRITPMKTTNTLMSSTRYDSANPDIAREQQTSTKPPMVQPLVRTHPERGTKAIYFHKGKVETVADMDPFESQDFLADLLDTALKPEFIYVHEWKAGDLLFIDNRTAMHKAGFDYDPAEHRHLHRVLVRGDRPF